MPFPSSGDLPDPGIEPCLCIACIGKHVLYQLSYQGNPLFFQLLQKAPIAMSYAPLTLSLLPRWTLIWCQPFSAPSWSTVHDASAYRILAICKSVCGHISFSDACCPSHNCLVPVMPWMSLRLSVQALLILSKPSS